MSHFQKDSATDKGLGIYFISYLRRWNLLLRNCRYSLRDGASFVEQARNATFDLASDEAVAAQKRAGLKWDKKKKKFIKGDGVGADNVKLVRTESGAQLPATFRSGRFDEWKQKQRVHMPKVGEDEGDGAKRTMRGGGGAAGKKWRHQKMTDAKPLDRLSKDYERKSRQFQKKSGESIEGPAGTKGRPAAKGGKGKGKPGALGRYGGKPIGRVKSELKSAEQIRKSRKVAENKRLKNARPSKKGRR